MQISGLFFILMVLAFVFCAITGISLQAGVPPIPAYVSGVSVVVLTCWGFTQVLRRQGF